MQIMPPPLCPHISASPHRISDFPTALQIYTRNGNVLQKCRQDNSFNDKDNMKMVLLPKKYKGTYVHLCESEWCFCVPFLQFLYVQLYIVFFFVLFHKCLLTASVSLYYVKGFLQVNISVTKNPYLARHSDELVSNYKDVLVYYLH